MKIIVVIALSCLIPMPTAFADESDDTTRKIIEQLFESFNRHDTDAVVDLYTDGAELMSPGDSKASIGSAAVREIYDDHFARTSPFPIAQSFRFATIRSLITT